MGRLSEIDTRVRMVKILDRLLLFLQARWRHEAVREAHNTGVYPSILRLVDFLDSAAGEMTDPVYGTFEDSSTKEQRNQLQCQCHAGIEDYSCVSTMLLFVFWGPQDGAV